MFKRLVAFIEEPSLVWRLLLEEEDLKTGFFDKDVAGSDLGAQDLTLTPWLWPWVGLTDDVQHVIIAADDVVNDKLKYLPVDSFFTTETPLSELADLSDMSEAGPPGKSDH